MATERKVAQLQHEAVQVSCRDCFWPTTAQVQIKNADMNDVLQVEVVELAKTAMDRFNTEKDIANFIKKELDRSHTPFWHCIVGRNFGSYVTHETKHFVYFYIDELAVLAFKAG